MAKNTPHKPHIEPKNNIAISIANGCILTASENKIGTIIFFQNVFEDKRHPKEAF